jgi:leucine dehydrogenase
MFSHPDYDDHALVVFVRDVQTSLKAIVAIHDLGVMGSAGGGCRMWAYASDEEAVRDALRLSRAMSYKLALVGLPVGGAKAVLLGDPARDKTEALLRAFGRGVESLGGRFIAAEDVGTSRDDMAIIGRETKWVTGEVTGTGDTGEATAHGVLAGIRVAVHHRLRTEELAGIHVAVQGLGHVGAALARLLVHAGAELHVADTDGERAHRVGAELGAQVVAPDAIYDAPVDVFSPCALGSVLTSGTVPRLRCRVVAGAANNQLEQDSVADAMASRGILYAPDFVMNAGGVLAATAQAGSGSPAEVTRQASRVGELLQQILEQAEAEGSTPWKNAVAMARQRMRQLRG